MRARADSTGIRHRAGAAGVLALIQIAAALATTGCDRQPAPVRAAMAAVDDAAGIDELTPEIEVIDAEQWVETFVPDESHWGYNLVLYRRRVPMLIDMQGRVVHRWPRVRASGRVRLAEDGRLLVLGIDGFVKEYDWEGELTWAHRLPRPEDLPHHDLVRLTNGNVLVLAQETATKTDYIHEVDRSGRVVWRWRATAHLDRHFPDRNRRFKDPTHMNSVRELPANRWFDAGDDRFRPGNILVSARNLDAIFIVDRATGEIVWTHTDGLDFQHEAIMIPRGVVGEGHIIFFNNGTHDRNGYRQSEIRVIDPTDGRLVWSYSDPTFFTTVAGSQQVLPNGNVLVTSSEGGRAFEITPAKAKVWEWIPPYLPMRVIRVEWDHCPQLEALGEPDRTPVARDDRPPWVDIELGQFCFRREYRVETLYGLVREVLLEPAGCRELLLPASPVIQAAYGFDQSSLEGAPPEATFELTVRKLGATRVRKVINETVRSDEPEPFRDRYAAVPGLDLQRVELCLDVTAGPGDAGEKLHPAVFLTNPRFYSQSRAQRVRSWKERRITEQERRQLEAIGYIQ
jgi:hypothetical protein